MALLFENKITTNKEDFIKEVQQYSKALGIHPDWLMAVMGFETSLTFSPTITNPISGAVGLIQFMPSTIEKEFGITVQKMKSLTNVQQLYYVYLYLKKYAGRMKSLVDVYFAVFFPIAIGQPLTWILKASNLSASVIANQNPIFDTNKDGTITVSEVSNAIINWVKKKEARLH